MKPCEDVTITLFLFHLGSLKHKCKAFHLRARGMCRVCHVDEWRSTIWRVSAGGFSLERVVIISSNIGLWSHGEVCGQ